MPRAAGAALADALRSLPDAAIISRIGESFEVGAIQDGEFALVRALPAPYLRAKASHRHWSVFAQYRGD